MTMRKALMGMLLAATAAVPAAALAQDGDRAEHYQRLEQRNQQRYEQRQQRVEQRQQRVEQRQQRVEQAQPAPEQVQQRQQRVEQRQQAWQGNRGQRGGWRGQDQQQVQQQQQQQQQQSWQDRRGQWQGRDRQGGNWQRPPSNSGGSGEWVGDPNDPRSERYRRRYEQVERQNQRDWQRDQRRDGRDWNRNDNGRRDQWGRNDRRWDRQWRNDRRYDWQGWRYSNRNLYRNPGYYAPYNNYRYSRLSIGLVLDRLFWDQRYWIGDPWQYRLPDPGPGFAWVRYYDDVLLIDTWSGEVVDVIYDFFW
jgi:hypothetical protein